MAVHIARRRDRTRRSREFITVTGEVSRPTTRMPRSTSTATIRLQRPRPDRRSGIRRDEEVRNGTDRLAATSSSSPKRRSANSACCSSSPLSEKPSSIASLRLRRAGACHRRLHGHFLPAPSTATTLARAGLLTTPHGPVETPVFMPVGTAGHRQGAHARDGPRRRRADHPGQHLSPRPSAGRRTHPRPRRPAQLHELAGADPHRLGRVPGLQPRRRRSKITDHGGEVQEPHRRHPARTHARAGRRDPGEPRLRHRHGARRVPARAVPTRR